MMRALEDEAESFSDWEKGFFASITDRFYIEGKELTPGQYVHLEKIYDRVFSGCKNITRR